MGAVAPELNFSLSELEQAGLLSCAEPQLVGLSGIPPAYALLGNAPQSDHSEAADPNTARGTARPKALLADPSSGVPLSQHASSDTLLVTETRQVQAQANAGSARRAVDSLDRKQAANRAHQARYRNRQKVRLTHVVGAVCAAFIAAMPLRSESRSSDKQHVAYVLNYLCSSVWKHDSHQQDHAGVLVINKYQSLLKCCRHRKKRCNVSLLAQSQSCSS